VRVWRLCRERYASDPLSGRGSVSAPGRWHPRGLRIVYTSATLSLAALEMLVHCDLASLPDDLVQVEIEIPATVSVETVDPMRLTPAWRTYPAPPELAAFGGDWLREGRTAVLRVPSAVVPEEWNLLIHPAHPRAARIRAVGRKPFSFDVRLTRS
jgi:RES domain-containing protein